LAADPVSGLLLQPSCRGLVQLHQLVFGSLLGTLFLSATGHGDVAADVCGTPLSSARLLVWHAWAVQTVLVPALAVYYMEWRLKKAFVRNHLDLELRYGPAWLYAPAGKQSSLQEAATWGRLQAVIVRPVMLVPLLGVLWSVLVAVLLRLPQEPCETCADTGTCQPHAPCGECCAHGCMCRLLHTCAVLLSLRHGAGTARRASSEHRTTFSALTADCTCSAEFCLQLCLLLCCSLLVPLPHNTCTHTEGVLCTMPGVAWVSGTLAQYIFSLLVALLCSRCV
jgi:hypothetical protein